MSGRSCDKSGRHPRLENLLARTLTLGTWLATAIIALGIGLKLIGGGGAGVAWVTAGIVIFLLLPVLRVLLMLVVFVAEGDYRFGAIAALVLAIIGLGAALGLRLGGLPG